MRWMGVDLGGTSTRVVVASSDGDVLAAGRAAGGNPRSSLGDPAENLAAAIRSADPGGVTHVGVGAAGTGSARRDEVLATLRRGLALAGIDAPVTFDTDFGIAYRAAAPGGDGRLLLAGTGAVAARFEDWALVRRFDGLGPLLGDSGSGAWIGREALRAVARALDGCGPATALTTPVLAHLGVAPATDDPAQALVRATDGLRPAKWAEFARFVIEHEDDEVAARVLDDAARALLGTLACAGEGPVVLAGGVLAGGGLRRRIKDAVGPAPHAAFPVVGACALAAAAAGGTLDRARLTAALAARG